MYFHYCGGELEEVSVLLKANSCCGEEEDESSMGDCCENASTVVRFDDDFLLKKQELVRTADLFATLFFVKVPFFTAIKGDEKNEITSELHPPPELISTSIIESTFLRI